MLVTCLLGIPFELRFWVFFLVFVLSEVRSLVKTFCGVYCKGFLCAIAICVFWLRISVTMSFVLNLEEFVKAPSIEVVHKCTREHLITLADHFKVSVSRQGKKDLVKSELLDALVEKGIFPGSVLPTKSPRLSSSEDSVRC